MPLVALTDAVLPAVGSLADCANFSLTVTPYLPQLQELPSQVLQNLSSFESLKSLYLTTNPLIFAIALALVFSPLCFILAEVTGNNSQVDRLWPILPSIYNTHYAVWAYLNGMSIQRMGALWACIMLWTCRLFYNYWRKGGYKVGEEDYRWEILKAKMNRVQFFLFGFFFVAFYQNILLLCITFPTYVILLASRILPTGINLTDVVFSRLLMGIVLFEWFADQQQWNFQQAKKAYLKTAKAPSGFSAASLDRGFVASGLWAYSRHPNFLAEQSVWVVLYVWAAVLTGSYLNWAVAGAVQYLILFQSSTKFSEDISSGKYPEYKEYQKRVGRFFPNLLGPGVGEWNNKDNEKKVQ